MPLIKGKSKKAFEHNIEAEENAGKPQDQALAIAFDVQRRARKRKMAEGGETLGKRIGYPGAALDVPKPAPTNIVKGGDMAPLEKENYESYAERSRKGAQLREPGDQSFAKGGETLGKRIGYPGAALGGEVSEHYEGIADAILAKRRRENKALGGMIEENGNAEETSANPNPFDEQNEEPAKDGDEVPEDLVGKIMHKRRTASKE